MDAITIAASAGGGLSQAAANPPRKIGRIKPRQRARTASGVEEFDMQRYSESIRPVLSWRASAK